MTTGEGSLWGDWCEATGRDPGQVTVETATAYLRDCPVRGRAARRDRLREALSHALTVTPDVVARLVGSPPEPDRAIRDGDGWLAVPEALALLDTVGYPLGFVARRDGWLLVLLGPVGLTRARALTVTAADIEVPDHDTGGWPTVAGVPAPFDADPDACSACAVTRWLRALAGWVEGGRDGASEVCTATPRGHDCAEPVPTAWRHAPSLSPSVDRHGWLGEGLSRRSVSAITAARQSAPADPVARDHASLPTTPLMGTRPAPDVALDDALDRLERAMAQMEAQTRQLLAAADAGGVTRLRRPDR